MNVKKAVKIAETTGVVIGAVALSSLVWWPLGPVIAGYWFFKRRWRKKKNN